MQAPEAFKQYKQFILWELVDGQKKPLHPSTLYTHSPLDPDIWLYYADAVRLAQHHKKGIGFVFTKNDPFFFLDIDKALVNGSWSELAISFCNQLNGCAIELSQSKQGIHIFGSAMLPPHSCGPHAQSQGHSLYHEERFAALTGYQLRGDAAFTPHQSVIDWLINSYFSPSFSEDISADWTDSPVPEWKGPEDDDVLIQKMLTSKSTHSMFSGRASLYDLWNCNTEVLSETYPPLTDTNPFDHSKADAALCAHLSFWTGKDCERIDRLFRRSSLIRNKWTDREDYRKRTILAACTNCKNVLGGSSTELKQPSAFTPDQVKTGLQYLTLDQQMQYFAGCVYVRGSHHIFVPDGDLLKPEQFNAWYGGYIFAMDSMNSKSTTTAWKAFTENQGVSHAKAHGTCFRPEIPDRIIRESGRYYVNAYVEIITPRQKGDARPLLNHIEKLLPNPRDREILLAYLAACVQYKGTKFQWCVLLQGVEGNGKTLLFECLAEALSWEYAHVPNAQHITNQFNYWLLNKLIIGVEEIYIGDRKEACETLKPWITNRKIEIHGKGFNQKTGDNRANFIMFSNYKDAIRKTKNDRRYCVFYTAQQSKRDIRTSGMGGRYFPNLYSWLRNGGFAIVTDFLLSYQIPDEFNPADLCHRAPSTSSTTEVLSLSMGGIEQEINEAVEEGRYGFANGWVSSLALNKLIETCRSIKTIPPNKRRQIIEDFGYIIHPGLPKGRVNNIIPQEGGKPVLYIKPDHPSAIITETAKIVENYLSDQGVKS